jgi:hypothetical protein
MAFDETKHFKEVAVRCWRIANQQDTFLSWTVASGWFAGIAMMCRNPQVEVDAWFLKWLAGTRAGRHKS